MRRGAAAALVLEMAGEFLDRQAPHAVTDGATGRDVLALPRGGLVPVAALRLACKLVDASVADDLAEYDRLRDDVLFALDAVAHEHGIRARDQFTCPSFRRLAETVYWAPRAQREDGN